MVIALMWLCCGYSYCVGSFRITMYVVYRRKLTPCNFYTIFYEFVTFSAWFQDTHQQGCSGAGTHGNAVPVNILAREQRSHKYVVQVGMLVLQSVGLLLFCADFLQWCNPVFCCYSKPFDSIWILYLLTTLVIGSSLLWEMMLWLSVSVI